MERLVIFGKGGSGKTTLATNLSTLFSQKGMRVLHVGLDPKRDSLLCLTSEVRSASVIERFVNKQEIHQAREIIVKGRAGMDCIDCGGIEPGVGCGGRAVVLTIETIERLGLLEEKAYDVVVFDLLGDLVCGGFAGPLRKNVGEKILVVVSDNVMSLFAANNICRAIAAFSHHGIYLAGLVVNQLHDSVDMSVISRFADRLATRIVGTIPHSPLIKEAEYLRKTVLEHQPRSKEAAVLKQLAERIISIKRTEGNRPMPMDDIEFLEFCRDVPSSGPRSKRRRR